MCVSLSCCKSEGSRGSYDASAPSRACKCCLNPASYSQPVDNSLQRLNLALQLGSKNDYRAWYKSTAVQGFSLDTRMSSSKDSTSILFDGVQQRYSHVTWK